MAVAVKEKPVVTSVFIQTDMYQEYVAETVGVQKERCGEGKCYDMEGLLLRSGRFSPASFIHGELKVVETNRKGSCHREVDPPASLYSSQEGTKNFGRMRKGLGMGRISGLYEL